jgi:hypothetical protein
MVGYALVWTDVEITLLESTIGLTNDQSLQVLIDSGFTDKNIHSVKRKRAQMGITNNNKWSGADIALLKQNYQTMTDEELATTFFPSRDWRSVAGKRLKLGLMKEAQWTPENIEILKTEYHKGIEHCMALFPQYTKGSIKWLGGNLGLSVNTRELRRKYYYKQDYFAEPTLENCYVAGFIAADGSLHCNKETLTIQLHQQDRIILEKFKNFFGYTGEIIDKTRQEKRQDGSIREGLKSTLTICGVLPWYTDLSKNFNITPNKTKTLQAPNLSSMDHKIAFVAGYTDGDGSIFWSGGKFYLSILGTESVIKFIKEVFDEIIPIPDNGKGRGSLVNMQNKYSFPLHKYTLSGVRAVAICQYIKQYPLPFLERKWSKVPTPDENKVI